MHGTAADLRNWVLQAGLAQAGAREQELSQQLAVATRGRQQLEPQLKAMTSSVPIRANILTLRAVFVDLPHCTNPPFIANCCATRCNGAGSSSQRRNGRSYVGSNTPKR